MFKKIDFKTIVIVVALIALGSLNFYMFRDEIFNKSKDNLYEVDIKNFRGIEDLKLTGVIYEVIDNIGNYHGTGILRVNIIETNIEYYDPRDKQINYYCIIKYGKSEIYLNNLSEVTVGDTITIDIPNEETRVFNNSSNKNRRMGTRVYPRSFFDFIKREGHQEI